MSSKGIYSDSALKQNVMKYTERYGNSISGHKFDSSKANIHYCKDNCSFIFS